MLLEHDDVSLAQAWEKESVLWQVYDIYSLFVYMLIVFLIIGFLMYDFMRLPLDKFRHNMKLKKLKESEKIYLQLTFNSKITGISHLIIKDSPVVGFSVRADGCDYENINDEIICFFEKMTNKNISIEETSKRFERIIILSDSD
jgi:hypothetical protein